MCGNNALVEYLRLLFNCKIMKLKELTICFTVGLVTNHSREHQGRMYFRRIFPYLLK